jgi:CheY-like chemotaxis protein
MCIRDSILLAEDEESDVLITRRALQRCGAQNVRLEVVCDGQALLNRLREGSQACPDLVLLDFNLPKINGLEALQAIKTDPELRHLPVLILTTSERPEEIEASYLNGANAFLVKPIRFERFVEMMGVMLRFWGEIARLARR